MASVSLGQAMPELRVETWLQGGPLAPQDWLGQVVLLEVFQVNCPGCFLYALPKAIEMHEKYADSGLIVIGLATAFEDFDRNTLQNLVALLRDGTVVGETFRVLSEFNLLRQGLWPLRIPFAVAMDKLDAVVQTLDAQSVDDFIRRKLPDIDQFSDHEQQQIRLKVWRYLEQLDYCPVMFEVLQLQGTPSYLLMDRKGILRSKRFGDYPQLEEDIQRLLAETG